MASDMHAMTAMARALDFFEKYLKEDIGISDAAKAAAYSLYHFCRLFNRYVHHTPYDYLIRRRLTEAARELKTTDRQIIDIAFEYQFNNHETFCRAFKRFAGMQPKEWRKKGGQDRRLILSRRTIQHLRLINSGIRTKPELTECRKLTLAGVSTTLEPDTDAPDQLWKILEGTLPSMKKISEPISFYAVRTYMDSPEQTGIMYMAAVEVASLQEVHPILSIKILPAGTYGVFSASGPYQTALDYFYQTWLPKTGRHPAFPFEIEFRGQDWSKTGSKAITREFLIPIQ